MSAETASTNLNRAKALLEHCAQSGLSDFCVCAGARNAPLVELLAESQGARLHHFFEERSASFFALGLSHKIGKPVAVVTTSGTAVAECLPAVIEAHYQGLPLVVLSADRPARFRGTGSPQAIEHIGLFSSYVEKTWDLEETLATNEIFSTWSRRRPLHINLAFEEPRRSMSLPVIAFPSDAVAGTRKRVLASSEKHVLQNPLVLVGGLRPQDRSIVSAFLGCCDAPVYCESLSGLRDLEQENSLLSVDHFPAGTFASVLRIGGVPTCRYWRDLEEKFKDIPVFNIVSEDAAWPGLARPQQMKRGFHHLEAFSFDCTPGWQESVFSLNRARRSRLQFLIEKYPRSEVALMACLSRRLQGQDIYLGNSLPIRHWDLVSGEVSYHDVYANRGANGIDGQLSTFLGWTSLQGAAAWAVVGDLTAMYDLAAPWVTEQLAARKRRLVVINNFGGMIFKKLFQQEGFLNRHRFEFSHWAQQWKWDYVRWQEVPRDLSALSSSQLVIELVPDEKESDFFREEWDKT